MGKYKISISGAEIYAESLQEASDIGFQVAEAIQKHVECEDVKFTVECIKKPERV